MADEKEAQQLMGQAQAYQQQMQGMLLQKEQLKVQLMEINKAMEELDKSNEKDFYRISGPLLIKTSKADAKKDLKEKQDLINKRLGTIESGEKRIKEKIEGLRQKLAGVSQEKGAG